MSRLFSCSWVSPELTSVRCHWSCPWRSWWTCVGWASRCGWIASWSGLRHSEPPGVSCPSHTAGEVSSRPRWVKSASSTLQSPPGLFEGQTCRNTHPHAVLSVKCSGCLGDGLYWLRLMVLIGVVATIGPGRTCGLPDRWCPMPGQPSAEWSPGSWLCWPPAVRFWTDLSEGVSVWIGSSPPLGPEL